MINIFKMYNNLDYLRDKFFFRFGNLQASKEEKDRMFRQFLYEEEMREMQERMQANSYPGGGEKTVSPVPITTTSTTTTTTMAPIPITNPDAYLYASQIIAAGGSIDYTTAVALDVLFNDLQGNYTQAGPSFYSVLVGFYPMLGTTSSTQSINANGNTAYDLQLFGGWDYSSLGMKGNGINTLAYVNKPYSGTDLENTHFSIYGTLLNNTPSNRGDLTITNVNNTFMNSRISLNDILGTGGIYEYIIFNSSAVYPANSGDFVVMSNDGTNTLAYQNGYFVNTNLDTPYLSGNSYLYLGISKYSGSYQYSTNRYGWSSFGGFMSTSDMSTYQTIVNTFMTSIGRNTY